MVTIDEFIERNKDCLKEGYVAMDKNGGWNWFSLEPLRDDHYWYYSREIWEIFEPDRCDLLSFNIAPVDDWETSLRKVG